MWPTESLRFSPSFQRNPPKHNSIFTKGVTVFPSLSTIIQNSATKKRLRMFGKSVMQGKNQITLHQTHAVSERSTVLVNSDLFYCEKNDVRM